MLVLRCINAIHNRLLDSYFQIPFLLIGTHNEVEIDYEKALLWSFPSGVFFTPRKLYLDPGTNLFRQVARCANRQIL